MRQRMREMDFIRAISALSIVLIHITGVYTYTSRGAYYINQLARFAVPVFILISGLLLPLSGRDFTGITGYLKFLSKRLKKLLMPYFIWSIIYILINIRNDLAPVFSNPIDFLLGTGRKLLYGTGHIHLYFIIIILQLYFLFPILNYMMKRWSRAVLTFSFILTLVYQTGIYLHLMKIITFPVILLPNYIFFPTWIFYFVFGMYFAGNLEVWKNRIKNRSVLLAIIWAASFVILIVDSKYTNTFSSSIKPSVMLYSMTTFLFMYSAALKLTDIKLHMLKILDWVSCQSFLIYLSHLLVMKIIIILSRQTANTGLWTGFTGLLVLYAATIIGTCFFAYAVSFTPFASMLGGVNKIKVKSPTVTKDISM